MTGKIIALPGATERFQLNTVRAHDLADLEVQLQKVATQIQRIHEEGLEAFPLPESYRIATVHVLCHKEQNMSGGVTPVALGAIEYIAGAVYIYFDKILSPGYTTLPRDLSYEEKVTVAIQGYLLLPSGQANHDLRRTCLIQADRGFQGLSEDSFYTENFPDIFPLLVSRNPYWLPHLREELNTHYFPESHLRRVK